MNSINSFNKTPIKLPKLPLIKNNNSINNYNCLSQSRNNFNNSNNFNFYLRLKKPLKIVEPTKHFFDSSLLLTKYQKKKLIASKIRIKQLKKENNKKFSHSLGNVNTYKNFMPIKIWKKCKKTYDECKHEIYKEKNNFTNLNNLYNFNDYNNKSKSIVNLNYCRNKKNYFENEGLSKFIDNIEKSNINHFHNNKLNNITLLKSNFNNK